MPIHPHLDGVLLDVAYRGSVEPQILDVGVKLGGPAEVPLAPWAIGALVECVNRGLAGGSDFAPEEGHAMLEAGPTGEGATPAPGELGPDYAFRLSVAGMSPRFVRVIAEHLAASGHPHPVRALSIVGSLPTDGSALSVRENLLAGWLDDPAAYPGVCREPGFPVVTRSIPRGATMRVTLAGGRMDDVARELEETFSAWQSAVLTYPNARQEGRGVMDPHGSFARTRTELYAKVSLFDHAREPARAALINALARFHRVVAPLSSVEIAMP
ncbi:MAG: hypothetical protein KF795_17355 [Labilithrix sp.]|nr:hypothetical protein [Labilithrix sp.]